MSQHDMNITDQLFPAFRSDLNNALAALVSNSSSATEPATMFAYQFWADTTTGILKQRNAANSAWISLYTLSGGPLDKTGGNMSGLLNQAAGANIASAATVDLTAATGNCPRITGTTATSAFTMTAGQQMWLIADGAWPLTYHATTNKIVGGISITLKAGDLIHVFKDLSGIVQTTPFSTAAPAAFATTSITSGNITTTSTSLVNLTGVTVTLTTTRGGPLAFAFECSEANNTANVANIFNIKVDDGVLLFGTSGIVASEVDTVNDQHHFCLSGITAALAAGSHEIKVVWMVNSASTGTVFSGASNAIRLSAWEI